MTEFDLEKHLEEIYGPPPTTQEWLELNIRNDQIGRAHLDAVLDVCYSQTMALEMLDMEFEDLWEKVVNKEFISIDIEGEKWLPAWQFYQKEDKTYDIHPAVAEAWDAWGRNYPQQLIFCTMMLWEEQGYGKTRLEILHGGADEEAKREVIATFRMHGITPM